MKTFFLIFTLLFLTFASFGQNSSCMTPPEKVSIRGFKLGMTEKDVSRRYPKIEIFRQDDGNGLSKSIIGSSYTQLDNVFNEAEREGLSLVELSFLDKKLGQIKITYDGFTEWDSVTEFTNDLSNQLKLPMAEKWQKSNKQSLHLTCDSFFIVSELEPKIGSYDLQKPSIFLSTNDFENTIRNRESDRKERQRRVFKP